MMNIPEIKIQNIVASTRLANKLDLDSIGLLLEGAEYEPEQFPGLIYRMKDPKAAILLFRSGKANCAGGRDLESVQRCIKQVREQLTAAGIEVYDEVEINIQNIVAVTDLGRNLNLNSIAITLGLEKVEYEPEQFPGLVFRMDEPKVALLIFDSGKVVCAGAKRVEELEEAIRKLIEELTNAGYLP
ncbi:MAG: TATA-box-binding protein [Thermoplasmata archaeon]|nr:TATA-box-binding protein [Thermoplasmata archaeon]